MLFDDIFKIVSADCFTIVHVCVFALPCGTEAQQSLSLPCSGEQPCLPVRVCAHTAASCCSQHCYRLIFLEASASYTLSDASCVRDLIDICFLLFLPTFYPFLGSLDVTCLQEGLGVLAKLLSRCFYEVLSFGLSHQFLWKCKNANHSERRKLGLRILEWLRLEGTLHPLPFYPLAMVRDTFH